MVVEVVKLRSQEITSRLKLPGAALGRQRIPVLGIFQGKVGVEWSEASSITATCLGLSAHQRNSLEALLLLK